MVRGWDTPSQGSCAGRRPYCKDRIFQHHREHCLQDIYVGSFERSWFALVPKQISRELFRHEMTFVPQPEAFLPRGYTTR